MYVCMYLCTYETNFQSVTVIKEKADTSKLDRRIQQLSKSLTLKATAEIRRNEAESDLMRAKYLALLKELEHMHDIQADMRRKLHELESGKGNSSVNVMQGRLDARLILEQNNRDIAAHNAEMSAMKRLHEMELDKLKSENTQLKNSLTDAESQMDKLQHQVDEANLQIQQLKDKIIELQSGVNYRGKNEFELRERIEQLEIECDNLRAMKEKYKARLDSMSADGGSLQQQLELERRKVAKLEHMLSQMSYQEEQGKKAMVADNYGKPSARLLMFKFVSLHWRDRYRKSVREVLALQRSHDTLQKQLDTFNQRYQAEFDLMRKRFDEEVQATTRALQQRLSLAQNEQMRLSDKLKKAEQRIHELESANNDNAALVERREKQMLKMQAEYKRYREYRDKECSEHKIDPPMQYFCHFMTG
jgi:chromosome segregation ATPase